jgi:outer membrane protein assembly factor BamB
MIGSAIRELCAARNIPLVAAAFYEGRLQVWDLASREMTSEFSARFAWGAQALSMNAAGDLALTGISAKRGSITAHRVPCGEVVWHRQNVPYCAYLRFDHDGGVSFTRDLKTVERLDPGTGATIEVLGQTARYIDGPKGHVLLAPSIRSNFEIVRGEHRVSVAKTSFGLLDAAFGPNTVCISESGGPIRCLDCLTGTELWRYTPSNGSHATRLYYSPVDASFYAVIWHYDRNLFRHLVRFDSGTGQSSRVCDLTSWDEVFCAATAQVVTASGDIIDLSSGEVVGQLGFPKIEYPDPTTTT